MTARESVDQTAVAQLLVRVLTHGVIERAVADGWSRELGVADDTIAALLADAVLVDDDGYLYVSEAGDTWLTGVLRGRLDATDEPAVTAFADDFTALDRELKAALTDWQRAQRQDDAERQLAAVETWLAIDGRLGEAVAARAPAGRLFGGYLDLLADARDAVLAGRPDRLSGADDDSYHSRWFLLHEVLLRTLGRQRSGG